MDSWTDNSYKLLPSDVETPQQFMPDFLGKWRLLKKHGFDEFLKSCGINIILRKAANALTPTEIIAEIDQNCYSLKTETVMKSAMVEFKLGQMIEEITIDGRKMKTTFKVVLLQHEPSGAEFYALAQFQRDSNDNIIEIFRFVRNDNLQVIMRINNTTAFAVFEPLK